MLGWGVIVGVCKDSIESFSFNINKKDYFMRPADFQPIINFIWSVADDLLRDRYVKGKYRDVILPMTIIRRLDAVLEPTKDRVLATYERVKELNDQSILKDGVKGSGYNFYNYSKFTLKDLLADPSNIRKNFENYLDGFSPEVKDIVENFKFKNQLDTLVKHGILFQIIERFCSAKVNFSIDPVKDKDGRILHEGLSNLGMGYVFEELIRKFNEENNEEAGEHFTPREIIQLMTHLVFLPVKDQLQQGGKYLVYDNACGSGGMLTESKDFITNPEGLGAKASIDLYGQEINPETYAICKADMLIKGENPDNIKYGSTLTQDGLGHMQFDFMLTNPPYGKKWGSEQKQAVNDTRFEVGVTGADDGQMMFLLNMISKMKHYTPLGSRIASVHNGSALFNSDKGQTAIRKHIIESDYLEAIVALPNNMFYNTGIPTYIWVMTNRKPEYKKGKVQLINATSEKYYSKMQKSLGDKKNQMNSSHIGQIAEIFMQGQSAGGGGTISF